MRSINIKDIKNKKIIGVILLLLASALWGSCFIFQKEGTKYIGPLTLGTFRFIIGALVMLPVIAAADRIMKNGQDKTDRKAGRKDLWKGGVLCGAVVFIAATLQQAGLAYTTAGKAAFLSSMQVVAVALFGIAVTKKLHLNTVAGVAAAVLGMYLLCIGGGMSVQLGDILELLGAVFWAAQILLIGKYSKITNALKLSFIQFAVAGALSTAGMFIFEKPCMSDIIACTVPILYTAVIEIALCYTLQIIGQKYVPAVLAAVTMSTEAVFASAFSAAVLKETLTGRQIGGMAIMLFAVIIVQMPARAATHLKDRQPEYNKQARHVAGEPGDRAD